MVDTLVATAGIAVFLGTVALVSYRNGFEWNRRTLSAFFGGTAAALYVTFALDSSGTESTFLFLLGVTVIAVLGQLIGDRTRSDQSD